MNILLVHSFYQNRGGEYDVFCAEKRLLTERGHTVTTWTAENRGLDDMSAIRKLMTTVWNQKSYADIRTLIRETRPDVIHCHNTFGVCSPSVYYAAGAEKVPVVQTLHNYRLLCLNALLFRNGHHCDECLAGVVPWPGVRHGCYHASRMASLGMTTMLVAHRLLQTWKRKISAYIALTDAARETFVAHGLPEQRVHVKPNFVFDTPTRKTDHAPYALFVGRLSEEKGIMTLANAWEQLSHIPLKVAGSGPEEKALRDLDGIDMLGWLDKEALSQTIAGARFVVIPSLCWESCPVVLAQAFCAGVPVVASEQGALKELITDGVTGCLFASGDPMALAQAANRIWHDAELCVNIRNSARREYEERFSPAASGQRLEEIYDRALANCKGTP